MNHYQRRLSAEEKERLERDLPWFGRRRHLALRDIKQGVVEVYEFDTNRIWDINGCRPPCCPHTLLFETTEGLFVYIESWKDIQQLAHGPGKSKLVIESTPVTNHLLSWKLDRPLEPKHTAKLREFNEFFEISDDAEWRTFEEQELPRQLMAALYQPDGG